MKKTIFVFLLFFCNYSYAQINLVRNPSFEAHDTCPNEFDDIAYANYWTGIDTNSGSGVHSFAYCIPEYYNTCGIGAFSLPHAAYFNHYARTGNGLAGMQMYYDTWAGGLMIDYLQGRLYHTLVAGQSYCVTFYVVLGSIRSGYATNHIGAYFDDGTIDTATAVHCSTYQTEYHPQIVDSTVRADTVNWMKIQGSFIANGTEKFMTIGNFFGIAGTTAIDTYHRGYDAYYIIDDVSVIATGTHATAGPDTWVTAGDSTYIGCDSNGEGMPCYWYVLGEPAKIDSGGRIKVHPTATTTYIVEMDLCGTITYDTVIVSVFPLGFGTLGNGEHLQLYPNPAKDNFTIEGALGCEVRIYNVVGQLVTVSPCCHSEPCCRGSARLTMTSGLNMTTNKEIVDISGLSKGVYIVEVLEPETGMRVSRRVVKE